MTSISRSALHCRQIVDAHTDNVVNLLARGFPAKPRHYWSKAPTRLSGKYFDVMAPKYFKGPNRPRLRDVAYTELPMFGP